MANPSTASSPAAAAPAFRKPAELPPSISLEEIPEGYRVYNHNIFLVAVLRTKHNRGLVREGAVEHEPMARGSWTIHFTAPEMPVNLLAAVAEVLKNL